MASPRFFRRTKHATLPLIEILAGWTGAVIVGAVSIWWTVHSQEQSKIDTLGASGVEATETMTSANQTTL